MAVLSISDRRVIGELAAADPGFMAGLVRDPARAVERSTGRKLPAGCKVDLIREGEEWAFVLVQPEAIDAVLPEPHDSRAAVENSAYELIRADPALAGEVKRDPARFARERMGLDLGGTHIVVHLEEPGALKIVVPNREHREVLSDDDLDLVSAGGQAGSNVPANSYTVRT